MPARYSATRFDPHRITFTVEANDVPTIACVVASYTYVKRLIPAPTFTTTRLQDSCVSTRSNSYEAGAAHIVKAAS
jgi:hypothetical protein